ncbi:Trimeric LpxA-like protein [Naviculisporaceae sp. PSN 640]
MDMPSEEPHPAVVCAGISFPAGNDDFRAARNYCAQACRQFNNTPEDAPPEVRSSRWLDIIRPARDRSSDPLTPAVTHDMTFRNPSLKSQAPFVKPPFYVDYGLRVRVGASTFINRGCMIMDTPVADVVVGERCNIGPNCCIVSVGHALNAEERLTKQASIGKPITVGNGVWIGANVTILGGVTIGDGAVIGAGSVITRSIPPSTLAVGVPARVIQSLDATTVRPSEVCSSVATLAEAMSSFARSAAPVDRLDELELARISSGIFPRLAPTPPTAAFPVAVPEHVRGHSSAKQLSISSTSSSATDRTPDSGSCSESTALEDDTDHEFSRTRRRRRREHSTTNSRSRRHRVMRSCPQLFKSDIMIVVAITSVAFTLLTCLFFAGMLMGAKWFSLLVSPAQGSPIE